MLGLAGALFLKVHIAHDDRADRNSLYLGVCFRYDDRVHIQNHVANCRRFFLQRQDASCLAGRNFRIIGRLCVSWGHSRGYEKKGADQKEFQRDPLIIFRATRPQLYKLFGDQRFPRILCERKSRLSAGILQVAPFSWTRLHLSPVNFASAQGKIRTTPRIRERRMTRKPLYNIARRIPVSDCLAPLLVSPQRRNISMDSFAGLGHG